VGGAEVTAAEPMLMIVPPLAASDRTHYFSQHFTMPLAKALKGTHALLRARLLASYICLLRLQRCDQWVHRLAAMRTASRREQCKADSSSYACHEYHPVRLGEEPHAEYDPACATDLRAGSLCAGRRCCWLR
jgi:hypothetical protein